MPYYYFFHFADIYLHFISLRYCYFITSLIHISPRHADAAVLRFLPIFFISFHAIFAFTITPPLRFHDCRRLARCRATIFRVISSPFHLAISHY
jgi:hypothetical protein